MPPARVRSSVAVGTTERGLSSSRMSLFSLGIVQPTPGGAEHVQLIASTLSMPLSLRESVTTPLYRFPLLGSETLRLPCCLYSKNAVFLLLTVRCRQLVEVTF